jgi:hypothetical protein
MSNPRGNIKHGGHGTLTYARWKSMMQRCHQPSATNFKNYGGNGIAVCERWHDFVAFRADMGECPSKGETLDRIDNTKGYEPGNCRWATMAEQNRNRSSCIELTHAGRTMILRDWATEIGITPNALAQRLYLGWSVERALTTPIKKRSVK